MKKLILCIIIAILSLSGTASANRSKEKKLECLKDYIRCEMRAEGCNIAKYQDNSYIEMTNNKINVTKEQIEHAESKQLNINENYEKLLELLKKPIVMEQVDCQQLIKNSPESVSRNHCCKTENEKGELPNQCSVKTISTIDKKIEDSFKLLGVIHRVRKDGVNFRSNTNSDDDIFNPCNIK